MVKQTLLGAILLSTVIFTLVTASAQNVTLALLALIVGAIWFAQELNQRTALNTGGFIVFVGLAAFASLSGAPLPLLLLGVAADLVAWDVSRFRFRIRDEAPGIEKTRLETSHMQKLAPVIAGGLGIALLPVLLTISVNFVVILLVMLVALLGLRQALLGLRGGDQREEV